MFNIDIAFKHNDIDFKFQANIARGKPHTFEVGEQMLADKLFWVLCGLDKNYTGTIEGEGISFAASSFNNVLALGDKTMYIRGSAERNIYKALRVRAKRKLAKERTEQVIKLYNLERLAKFNIKLLEDDELLTVSLARAHFRKIRLVIFKNLNNIEIDLSKFKTEYIITIC